MDIQAYIASGILESYALGVVSDQERREVECLSKIYPELKQELSEIEISLEKFSEHNAVTPPVQLKAKVMNAIRETKQEAKIVQMKPDNEKIERLSSGSSVWKIVAAASVAAVVALTVMFRSSQKSQQELTGQLEATKLEAQKELTALTDSLALAHQREVLMADAGTEQVVLGGTDLSPESHAKVFYNKEKAQFVLVADGLPQPTSGNQYQLWAIADGAPVDLGVIDKKGGIADPKVIHLEKVQAFAITLEKDGGSPTPTLEQMYVFGPSKS